MKLLQLLMVIPNRKIVAPWPLGSDFYFLFERKKENCLELSDLAIKLNKTFLNIYILFLTPSTELWAEKCHLLSMGAERGSRLCRPGSEDPHWCQQNYWKCTLHSFLRNIYDILIHNNIKSRWISEPSLLGSPQYWFLSKGYRIGSNYKSWC
jgi:hypothetical protein